MDGLPRPEGLNCPIAKRAVKCRIFGSFREFEGKQSEAEGTPRVVTIKMANKSRRVTSCCCRDPLPKGYMVEIWKRCHTMLSRFTTAAHLLFADFMATASFPFPCIFFFPTRVRHLTGENPAKRAFKTWAKLALF